MKKISSLPDNEFVTADSEVVTNRGGRSGRAKLMFPTFGYVYNNDEPHNSMLHYKPRSVGEVIQAHRYYKDVTTGGGLEISAPSIWEVYEISSVPLSPDNTDYGESYGFTVQGIWAKFKLLQNSRTDIGSVGIKPDGESLNQIARLERLIQATALNRGTLAGNGVLMVDSQIDSVDCFWAAENLRLMATPKYFGYLSQIKGGAAVKDAGRLEMQVWGTPNGAWGIYPLAQRRKIVTFDAAADTVTDTAHGRQNGSLVRFESRANGRKATGSGMPDGVSSGTWYRIKNATENTYQLGKLSDDTLVPINAAPSGVICAYYGGKRIVTASVASPTIINDPAHGLTTGKYKAFYSTGTLPAGITSGTYYKVVVIDADTYSLQSILTDAAINVTAAGTGIMTADGRELEMQNVNEGVIAFRVFADSSAQSSYKLHASYCGKGAILEGNTEKEKVEIHAVGCNEILSEISTKEGVITLDHTTDRINWANHGLSDRAIIQFGGDLPPEIFEGRRYKIINKTTNDFQVTELSSNTPLGFNSNGEGELKAICENGTVGGSSDTNNVEIIGTRCERLYTSGWDNTSRITINFEGPIDLGREFLTTDGALIPLPRILSMNGKATHLSGNLRTHNGAVYVLIDREGVNAPDGSDSIHFDNLRFTDNCYGILAWLRRVQRATGHIYIRHAHNGRVNSNDTGAGSGIGNIPCPSVWIGQVYGGNLGLTILHCDAREGLRIGDAAYNLFPRNWHMGECTVVMSPFNPRTGIFPSANAVVFEKVEGGVTPFGQIEGHIRLEAGCQGPRIEVPSVWATRYALSADPAATATLVIKGSMNFSEIAFKPWLRPGIDLVVESLTDFGGAEGRYKNGKWIIAGVPLVGVTADFASISHDLNQKFKRKGLQAYDGSRLLLASGDAAADPWTYHDGSNANTVGWQAATAALVARMSSAPSTARQLIYDKLYYDLNQAGLLGSKLIALYVMGGHDEAASLLNLISTNYNLVKNGAPTFTPNSGFTGTGNPADFLATGFNATVAAEGMGQNDAHSGVFGLTNASSGAGEIMGCANGRMAIKIATGGSSYAKTTTSSNVAIAVPAALPRHVLGNRVIAGTHTIYDNGALANSSNNASNGLPDAMTILKGSAGATLGQAFAAHFGKGLTGPEIAALYQALNKAYNGFQVTA